eukprot:2573038-Prymnesium_polylepis.1
MPSSSAPGYARSTRNTLKTLRKPCQRMSGSIPISLHGMYRTIIRDEKEPLDERRIQGNIYQPHHYLVPRTNKLIEELDIAGEICGKKSVLKEVEELRAKLEDLKEYKELICRHEITVKGDPVVEIRRCDKQ